MECRKSILVISTAHLDKLRKAQGGLDGADIAFITHITGSTNGGRLAKQDHTSLSLRLVLRGSQTKVACVLHMTLSYITSVYVQREKVKKQSHRTRNSSQKEIRRDV